MKFLWFVFLFTFVLMNIGHSQGNDLWPEKVDALYTLDEHVYRVEKETKAKYQVHQVIIIFNKDGNQYANVHISEDNFRKCKEISATLWTLDGEKIKEFKTKDFDILKYSGGGVFYEENARQRVANLSHNHYPYKIEISWEMEHNSLFFWPHWLPQRDIPVLKSSYTLILKDAHFPFKSYPLSDSLTASEQKIGDGIRYYWELKKIPPKKTYSQIALPPDYGILFAPGRFTLGKYQTQWSDWKDVGNWYNMLTQGRYLLPEEAHSLVEELTAGLTSEKEKVAALYYFLQNYTRYVAIYLGIGGWQPHGAGEVFRKKYGDCKDLSTFMVALLKEAGIEAYPALTPTRDAISLIKEFPSNQFNHCITMVPLREDTLWLECTADYLAAGDLPPTVEGVNVLVVEPNNSKIVKTPVSKPEENCWKSVIRGSLVGGGRFEFQGDIIATGNVAWKLRNLIIEIPNDYRDRFFQLLLSEQAASSDVQYDTENLTENYDKPLVIHLNGEARKFAKVSSQRIFLNPVMFNAVDYDDIPDEEKREKPFYHNYAFINEDSLILKFPWNYRLEAAPDTVSIKTDFGEYLTRYSYQNEELVFYRRFQIKRAKITPEEFDEYRSFLKQVYKADKAMFVFKH